MKITEYVNTGTDPTAVAASNPFALLNIGNSSKESKYIN